MASDSCIPVKVALQLMDPSSLGLADQYDQFQEVHQQLQNALKVIVNEHHQGFNSSIGTFHKIQAAIHASQHRVRTLKQSLLQAKSSLGTSRPELKAFATSSQSYDQMLQSLGHMEQLQLVPERLEAQISEKRFLGAVDTLQDALRLIRRPEMEDIGALSDLRVYLSNQEHSVTDILIEELHSHLYLKSPYCEERWKSHASREAQNASVSDTREMNRFLESFDGSAVMTEDITRNPEADTFSYIQLLVESLNRMSRLDVTIDAIDQRLPVELFRVVERSHTEVESRHPSIIRTAARNRQDKLGLYESSDNERKATLEDLLSTLYAKFEAIAEGHRVMHDVVAAVLRRDGPRDGALNRSFRELWKLLQSEIRSLLHDHLTMNGNLGHRSRQENDGSANIFRPTPRDRNRKLFKLADTDSKSTDLATEREDLEFILKASVPGLVSSNKQDASRDKDANALPDRSATGHKLLVDPSVFNMGILLPPSLDFLNRLKDVVPHNSGVASNALTSFLDDFLVNVFYPQLDETLVDLCTQALIEIDAFQPDPKWQTHSHRPIFKGTVRFFELMEAFCKMLDSLPHDQAFSQLLITQMRTYYDKCFGWSKALLQRAQLSSESAVRMRLAAELATSGQVNEVVISLLKADEASSRGLAERETALLLEVVGRRTVEEADLINDRKALAALCTLHTSMKWLSARCSQLRYISDRAVDSSQQLSHHQRRWTTGTNTVAPSHPYLPLNPETATAFDAVVISFTELSTLVLRTLHIDLRLHLLFGISNALSTTYRLEQPYNDPDLAILNLSTDIMSYDEQISSNLMPAQYAFLTANLSVLVNTALTAMASSIQGMDEHGAARMQLNVLVLQQSLKNLQRDADLNGAARFYELFDAGPEGIAKTGVSEGLPKEDLKSLLRLCYSAKREGGQPQKSLEDYLSMLR